MESIIEFMYLGQTTLLQDTMDEFLKIARNLKIKGISSTEIKMKPVEENIKKELDPYALTETLLEYSLISKDDLKQKSSKELIQSSSKNERNCWSCKECGSRYESEDSVKRHYKVVHPEFIQALHKCGKCNFGSSDLESYKAHLVMNHLNSKYQCNQCTKSFETYKKLKGHIQFSSNHDFKKMPLLNTLTNFCNICCTQFPNQKELRDHMMKIHS